MEPELENVVVELAAESSLIGVFPFAVDDFEGDVFVWRTGVETEIGEFFVVGARRL